MAIGRPISLTPNVATQNFTVTATADQTSFTVTGGYRLNELGVYRNGVRLIQGKDFTASDGSTVTLLSGAVVDDTIDFVIFDSFNIADAINSVGNQTIDGELTATKFIGDGGGLTGVGTANINTNNIQVSGIPTLGTETTVVGSAVTFDASGGTIVGVLTATSFEGDGSSLTGVAATDYVVSNTLKVLGVSTFVGNTQLTATTASTSSATGALVVSGGVGIAGSLHVGENVSVGGTLTYEDVTNIDVIGIITARAGVLVNGGRGIDIAAGGLEVTGLSTFKTGLSVSGVSTFTSNIVATATTSLSVTAADESSDTSCNVLFSTAATGNVAPKTGTNLTFNSANGTLTATSFSGDGSNLSNLPAAGLNTSASTAAGIVSTLALSSAQDHKVTVSGISTFTCNGGTEGDSHTLRITNSGITTIGFSTYFLFPSGSEPSIPTADGTVSLISFTVHRVGTPGIATQLLAGASLNFS